MTAPRAAALAGAGFVLRQIIAPSYGYSGVDGDLIEHKQAVHVALQNGVHEIYRANARNDPALKAGARPGPVPRSRRRQRGRLRRPVAALLGANGERPETSS